MSNGKFKISLVHSSAASVHQNLLTTLFLHAKSNPTLAACDVNEPEITAILTKIKFQRSASVNY